MWDPIPKTQIQTRDCQLVWLLSIITLYIHDGGPTLPVLTRMILQNIAGTADQLQGEVGGVDADVAHHVLPGWVLARVEGVGRKIYSHSTKIQRQI